MDTFDIFDMLTLFGGIALFLFGMDIMGQSLERRAGNKLRLVLSRLTGNPFAGFFTGCGVTCVIQSSAATAVMAIGFVNSGLMTLRQSINVIIGANVGTTITGWILSLNGISGNSIFLRLLKPESFTPILAAVGIVLYMFVKDSKKKDNGMIMLGFSTLMFGMQAMSTSMAGLKNVPWFQDLLKLLTNPVLGFLIGIFITALIQSSSASVGILQALATKGGIVYGAAIPMVLGAGIGATIPSLLAGVGANKDAKRAAFINVVFNTLGAVALLIVYYIVMLFLRPAILDTNASVVGIAITNTAVRLLCSFIFLPNTSLLEKIACKFVPDSKTAEQRVELDERLLATPPLALQQCRTVASEMAACSIRALKNAISSLDNYSGELAESIHHDEDVCDYYEDILGTFLIKLSASKMGDADAGESAELLKTIGDFERISDHAVNILESAEEIRDKKIQFSEDAQKELKVICAAVCEIVDLTMVAFRDDNIDAASKVEPLEELIDSLKELLRTRHIMRLQVGDCGIEVGFIWADLLTNLERTSDHCSNIAACVLDTSHRSLGLHETIRATKLTDEDFKQKFEEYSKKYVV